MTRPIFKESNRVAVPEVEPGVIFDGWQRQDPQAVNKLTVAKPATDVASAASPIAAEQTEALLKIQRTFRGYLTRKRVVKPAELKQAIDEQLGKFSISYYDKPLREEQRSNLSRAIARQILDIAENPKEYAGHGLRLEMDHEYEFPKFAVDVNDKHAYVGKDTVKLPCKIVVSRSQDKKDILIEMQGKELGSGGFNWVHQTAILTVNVSKVKHEIANSEKFVTRVPKKSNWNPPKVRFDEIPKEVRENPDFRVAGIGTYPDRKLDSTGRSELRYLKGISTWRRDYTHAQQIQILQDAATTLGLLHKSGLVHRDFKSDNVVAILEHSNQPRGHIIDWDSLSRPGKQWGQRGTIGNEDPLDKERIVTPLTDIFALAQLACSVCPKIPDQSNRRMVLSQSAIDLTGGYYQEGVAKKIKAKQNDEDIKIEAQNILNDPQEKYQIFLKALKEYNDEILTKAEEAEIKEESRALDEQQSLILGPVLRWLDRFKKS